jgi:hypothetical protein
MKPLPVEVFVLTVYLQEHAEYEQRQHTRPQPGHEPLHLGGISHV